MPSVNKVIIVGNLGRDPEIRYMPSGDAIANIAVATSYKTKDRDTGDAKEYTEWHRINFFGRLAEIVGEYLKKGSSIYVEGRLQTRKYTDKDGIERYVTEIVGEHMQMLGDQRPRDDQGQAQPAARPQSGTSRPPARQPAPNSREARQNAQRPAPRAAPDFPDDDIGF